MKSFLTLLSNWVFLGFFLCSSCTHYYYAPEDGNLLALNEEGDLKASASTGIGISENPSSIYSFQAGYSPINGLGFQTSYFHIKNFYDRVTLGKMYIASGAVGYYYFKEFEKANEAAVSDVKASKQGLLFDVYLGGGIGQIHNYYGGGGRSNFIFNKIYLQGGFHWQGKWIGADIVGRLVRLDYDKAILSGNIETWEWETIGRISDNNPFIFFETSSRFHVGNKHLKFYFGQATIFPSIYTDNIDFLVKSFQIGVFADIDSFFDKKPASKKRYSSKKKRK